MGKSQRVQSGWGVFSPLVIASVALFGLASPAWAVGPAWLRHVFAPSSNVRDAAPPVARYVIDTGGDFVLDRTLKHPLLKFEDNPEVWALTVSRGPRGDLIYWNDLGQPVLRMTKLGGVTIFTPTRPKGSAAALSGPSAPLRLASVGPGGLYQHLALASARSGRAAQHPVGFAAVEADATSDGLMADAAIVTSQALVDLASRPRGRAILRRIGRVTIIRGQEPDAKLDEGVIVVTVAPAQGLFGRPSSLRIEEILGVK